MRVINIGGDRMTFKNRARERSRRIINSLVRWHLDEDKDLVCSIFGLFHFTKINSGTFLVFGNPTLTPAPPINKINFMPNLTDTYLTFLVKDMEAKREVYKQNRDKGGASDYVDSAEALLAYIQQNTHMKS